MNEIEQILNSICGIDADGESKCIIGFKLILLNQSGEEIKVFDSESIYKPIVNIFVNNAFVQMDVEYDSAGDVSLQRTWNILEKYTSMNSNRMIDDIQYKDELAMVITLIPVNGDIEQFIVASNPVLHCITALGPKKPVSCIRMLFAPGDIHFMKSDPIDTMSLDTEVEEEIRRREFAEQTVQTRREKRIEEMERLEELRKRNK